MLKIGAVIRWLRLLLDPAIRLNAGRAIRAYQLGAEYDCPCCFYRGRFDVAGDTLHPNAECPSCHAMDRHRLLAVAARTGFVSFAGKRILHFAPEPAIGDIVQAQHPLEYATADLMPGAAEREIDITAMAIEDSRFDLVICSHVLEHVDDRAALAEIHRILRPGGEALLMVPIIESWEHSFEDESVREPAERHRFFGQWNHVRYYGADFRDRVRSAGFTLLEFMADGRQCAEMGLARGEILFRAIRQDEAPAASGAESP